MHCSNPKCYDDSCNGECEKVEQVKEERDWPWYRYEDEFDKEKECLSAE
tara:strand:+ start:206 stop:352 length:147 start_codon:yes stop_codon:yes gene_type:complete